MSEQTIFQERVIHLDPPDKHHLFLVADSGNLLGLDDNGQLTDCNQADDSTLWDRAENGFFHTASGSSITPEQAEGYNVQHGPENLPSEYLSHLNKHGWVVLNSILSPETVEALEYAACTDRYAQREYDTTEPALCQHAAIAQTVAEPVSLWLIRQYMMMDEIRLGHVPGFAILTQDDGKRIVQGWHSDYPYHWGVPARGRVPTPSGPTVLGVQRNVCVSDFTKVGGATAFKLGSHARDSPPPEGWGLASDHYKPGYRAEHGLPYSGPKAEILEAPGGSIILYDARTWHRAGINRTPHKRAALLQAMLPMYILPKNDTSRVYRQFIESDIYDTLNAREKREMQNLMVHHFIGPGGEYAISPDRDLTEIVREG